MFLSSATSAPPDSLQSRRVKIRVDIAEIAHGGLCESWALRRNSELVVASPWVGVSMSAVNATKSVSCGCMGKKGMLQRALKDDERRAHVVAGRRPGG